MFQAGSAAHFSTVVPGNVLKSLKCFRPVCAVLSVEHGIELERDIFHNGLVGGVLAYAFVLHILSSGIGSVSSGDNGVVPVLYLSSDITLQGEGTSQTPYTLG